MQRGTLRSPSGILAVRKALSLSLAGQFCACRGDARVAGSRLADHHSDEHSTVWDGDVTLFDFNFSAMEVPADQCFQDAFMDELARPIHCLGACVVSEDRAWRRMSPV
jgi:hypothetical protein